MTIARAAVATGMSAAMTDPNATSSTTTAAPMPTFSPSPLPRVVTSVRRVPVTAVSVPALWTARSSRSRSAEERLNRGTSY